MGWEGFLVFLSRGIEISRFSCQMLRPFLGKLLHLEYPLIGLKCFEVHMVANVWYATFINGQIVLDEPRPTFPDGTRFLVSFADEDEPQRSDSDQERLPADLDKSRA